MPSAPVSPSEFEIDRKTGVHQQRDFGAVAGEGGGVAQPGELGAALQPHPEARLQRGDDVGARPQVGLAALGVDDHRVAFADLVAQTDQPADAGDVERPGDDRGVAGGRALLEQDALQLAAVVFQQVGRAEAAGDQDRVVGQHPGLAAVAGQVAQQAVVEVLEVVDAFAQVMVARLAEAGAMFGAHPLDGHLRRDAGAHRLGQRAVPAAAVGQHLVGLEQLVAGAEHRLVALEHLVDLGLQFGDGLGQPRLFRHRVVAEQLADRHRRLVQHRDAEREAVGQLLSAQPLRPLRRELDVLQLERIDQVAGRDHLGQHHGDDLQVLDLVLAIDPAGAVLDHDDADRAPAAQQRHAEEGVERVLAGLRPVREGRVSGGVRQVERPAQPHDLADQALAGLHPGDVDGAGVEALCGEQLHLARLARQVERTDLGHHRDGDDPRHHVELGLRRARARHRFADLAKQAAGSADGDAGRGGHELGVSPVSERAIAGFREGKAPPDALPGDAFADQPKDAARNDPRRLNWGGDPGVQDWERSRGRSAGEASSVQN